MREHSVTLGKTRYGLAIYSPSWGGPGRAFSQYGEYSESEVEVFRQYCGAAGCAYDIGANIGAHSLALSKIFSNVLAVEKEASLAAVCAANMALNNIANVQVLAGTVDQYIDEFDYWPKPDLIKVDVDGPELEVLQALGPIIKKDQPVLYLENDVIATSEAKLRYLYDIEYTPYWHMGRFYNPANILGAPCEPSDQWLVSIMLLALPSGAALAAPLRQAQLGDTSLMCQEGDHIKLVIPLSEFPGGGW